MLTQVMIFLQLLVHFSFQHKFVVLSGKKAQLSLSNIAEPKYSKAISEYSNMEQTIIKKVQQITTRFLSKPSSIRNQMHAFQSEDGCFQQTKRRASNSEEDFVQTIVNELNFSLYKAAYTALIEFFDMPADQGGYHTGLKLSLIHISEPTRPY